MCDININGEATARMVHVSWIDSKDGTQGWDYADEIEPLLPVECETIGFLIDDNKAYKTLAMSQGGGQVLGRITIPACAIKKLVFLDICQ